MKCSGCGHNRVDGELFFRLITYVQTMGYKPRRKSEAASKALCPECAGKLTDAELNKLVSAIASADASTS